MNTVAAAKMNAAWDRLVFEFVTAIVLGLLAGVLFWAFVFRVAGRVFAPQCADGAACGWRSLG